MMLAENTPASEFVDLLRWRGRLMLRSLLNNRRQLFLIRLARKKQSVPRVGFVNHFPG